jgi:hypothetical protein
VNAKLRLDRESDTFFGKAFGEHACMHVHTTRCTERACTVHVQILSLSSLKSASSARNSASSSFTVSHIPGCGSLASVNGATLPRLPAHHAKVGSESRIQMSLREQQDTLYPPRRTISSISTCWHGWVADRVPVLAMVYL